MRATPRDGSGGRGGLREFLDGAAGAISSNLTASDSQPVPNESGLDGSSSPPRHLRRRGISAVLRWLVAVAGSDGSRTGRIIVAIVGFAREVLLRSVGAASVVLTGAPAVRRLREDGANFGAEGSLADACNPVLNGHAAGAEDLIADVCTPVLNGNAADIHENGATDLQRMEQDLHLIDRVLSYWFGQASPDGAQKSLWMISSSSAKLLNRVDADISNKFRSLVLDLASDFGGDEECTNSLGGGTLQRWTGNVEAFGWRGKLAAILALDQMSRHIHRHDKNHPGNIARRIPPQSQLDRIAYEIAKQLQEHHRMEFSTGIIPVPMRIFGIMPLRHASTVEDLTIVQQDVEAASSLHGEMDKMIRRFRKATNRRMAALQDEARREGKLGSLERDANENDGGPSDQHFDDEKILECFPFKADMSKARDHVVVKTMRAFLGKMNILQTTDARFKSPRKAAGSAGGKPASEEATTPNEVPTAIVSLSGGVDSMVIASALAYLRDEEAGRKGADPAGVLRIVGIHIDYANRPESGAEAAYVGRYCKDLGIEFVCRKIDEVTRGVTARDDYERIAREIRFGLYRRCCEGASNGTGEGGIGVMLGHHRGDLRENVISNAHKGHGPLDLSGMTAVSRNDGVNLFRPLLPLEKTFIYDYSHKFGVPYFKDTTPHWSTRGKLRNRLIPLLEEIYGEGSMDNLSSLAEESDDARALVQQTVMAPFMDRVNRYPMGITFETSQWKDCSLFFWKIVLRQVLHSAGLGMFSDKSVGSFLDRVQTPKLWEGWLQCRKNYAVFLQEDGRVFVFHPRSFPFCNGQKKGPSFDDSPAFLGYGRDKSVEVGPWTVTSEIVGEASEKEANSLLQTKALRNMEHLMNGDITYFMKVPASGEAAQPCPLTRVSGFAKLTRPAAWKGSDLKVESTLPLLGVNYSELRDELSGAQEYGKTWVLVKVRLLLDSQNRAPASVAQDALK